MTQKRLSGGNNNLKGKSDGAVQCFIYIATYFAILMRKELISFAVVVVEVYKSMVLAPW